MDRAVVIMKRAEVGGIEETEDRSKVAALEAEEMTVPTAEVPKSLRRS